VQRTIPRRTVVAAALAALLTGAALAPRASAPAREREPDRER
jgi:hypothetical protein